MNECRRRVAADDGAEDAVGRLRTGRWHCPDIVPMAPASSRLLPGFSRSCRSDPANGEVSPRSRRLNKSPKPARSSTLPAAMSVTVLVGGQWGDEGKGKVIDLLADKVNMVIRSQGGNNAGHTVVTGGREHRFHLIPQRHPVPEDHVHHRPRCRRRPEGILQELDELQSGGIPRGEPGRQRASAHGDAVSPGARPARGGDARR